MLAMIILCGMVGILVYFQVFSQGLFSAMIMAVLSALAAIVALNYQECLANIIMDNGLWAPPYATSLLGSFSIILLILREAFDRVIRGNMNFSLLVDRIGSAIFAFLAAMVIVGMIAIGFQSLPVDSTILGFNRCKGLKITVTEMGQDRPDKKEAEAFLYAVGDEFKFRKLDNPPEDAQWNSLFPSCDSFVEKMFNHVSKYSFSNDTVYAHVHPNITQELYLNRLTPLNYEGMRHEAKNDSIKLNMEGVYLIESDDKNISKIQLNEDFDKPLEDDEVFIAVTVTINSDAADIDKKIRFALSNFRLVGFDPGDRDSKGCSRYPEIGKFIPVPKDKKSLKKMLFAKGAVIRSLNQGYCSDGGKSVLGTVLFRWPSDIKKITPLFLEFKHSARVDMPSAKRLLNEESEDGKKPKPVSPKAL